MDDVVWNYCNYCIFASSWTSQRLCCS